MKTISGDAIARIGQGTWFMGEKPALAKDEIEALRAGAEHGMNLIDTAEMYGDGASEELVGEAIRPLEREKLFLVSKVYPHNAGGARLVRSCENSLKRLGVDCLDLYLLHWRGSIPFKDTIDGMRKLQREGKIRYWGVSNLDKYDMQELVQAGGAECAVNQVLYHLGSRGVEYDLLPWLLRRGLLESAAIKEVASRHGWTQTQVLLAFAAQPEGVIAIPKAGQKKHAIENAAMLHQRLTQEDLAVLNAAFPAPTRPEPLDIV